MENFVTDVKVENIEKNDGTSFRVANFSIYSNISVYEEKVNDVKDMKRGDFIKIFGQARFSLILVKKESDRRM